MGLRSSKRQASARALVIGADESKLLTASVSGATAGNSEHTEYRVRVVPEDGQPEFESKLSTWGWFAHYGTDIHDFWIQVVYDPDSPEKCQIDKDWLHKLDRADWYAKESRRRHEEQFPGRTPVAFPVPGAPQGGGAPAGDGPSADTDPVAYWKQYSAGLSAAAGEVAAANLPQASPTVSPENAGARLAAIEKLHQTGALNDDEYQAKRQQIIDSI